MSAKLKATADAHESDALSTNQERLLYLLSFYAESFLSIPQISVLVFEGTKEPEEEDSDSEEESNSRRSEDVSVHVSDKYAFTYTFFQSFADVAPGTQVQIYASMVLKNDLRYFKKQNFVTEEKENRDTGMEHCYRITDKGRDLILPTLSEKSKLSVKNIVHAPDSTNLLSVVVKDKSFYVTAADPATGGHGFEKKSAITSPQERADEEAQGGGASPQAGDAAPELPAIDPAEEFVGETD